MSPDRFRILIEGALAAWRADAEVAFSGTEPSCRIEPASGVPLTVSHEVQPFGPVWRIAEEGRRERVHTSIVPALRGLRGIVAPSAPSGRVLFVEGRGA